MYVWYSGRLYHITPLYDIHQKSTAGCFKRGVKFPSPEERAINSYFSWLGGEPSKKKYTSFLFGWYRPS